MGDDTTELLGLIDDILGEEGPHQDHADAFIDSETTSSYDEDEFAGEVGAVDFYDLPVVPRAPFYWDQTVDLLADRAQRGEIRFVSPPVLSVQDWQQVTRISAEEMADVERQVAAMDAERGSVSHLPAPTVGSFQHQFFGEHFADWIDAAIRAEAVRANGGVLDGVWANNPPVTPSESEVLRNRILGFVAHNEQRLATEAAIARARWSCQAMGLEIVSELSPQDLGLVIPRRRTPLPNWMPR